MKVTAEYIIDELEKIYQIHVGNRIPLCLVEYKKKDAKRHQFLIGLTPYDSEGVNLRGYEHVIEERYASTSVQVNSLAYPFEINDVDNFKSVLRGVVDYFGVSIDADDLISHYRINRMKGSIFYMVITVLVFTVLEAR